MNASSTPAFTVNAVILAGSGANMRLLVCRTAPGEDGEDWALPGGCVAAYEQPLVACLRELKTVCGLDLNITPLPLTLRSSQGRDPRGWTLAQPFLFHVPGPLTISARFQARVRWMMLSDLKQLASDHGAVLCEALGLFWTGMPSAHPALSHVRGFGVPKHWPWTLTFFGGSFDPLHEGHLACVTSFPHPHQLVIVPDANPFKDQQRNRCAWLLYRRLVRVFFFERMALAVYPGFCGRELPNPTVSWLPHVRTSRKGLLLGEDSAFFLPSWYNGENLVQALDHLYVVPRMEDPDVLGKAFAWVSKRNSHCRIVHLPPHPHQHRSSTILRQQAE